MTATAGAGGDPFERRYEGATLVVNGVRADVDRWLRGQSADDDTRSRAALVVSELVSNAIQASPGTPFELQARRIRSGAIAVTVTNNARDAAIPPPQEWGPDDVLAPGGRGLAIVDALCEDVHISQADDGDVTVQAVLAATFC